MVLVPQGRMYRLHPYLCFQEDDVMYLAPSKESLAERSRPPFDAGRKLSEIDKALLWQLLKEAPECPSRELLAQVAQRQGLVPVSVRHLNRLRVQWMLNRPKGRPRHAESCPPVASGTEVVRITPRLSFVCTFLPIGSTTRVSWTQWWSNSRRRWKPISERIRATTLPCCNTGSRRCGAAFKRYCWRPCLVLTDAPRSIPTSIHSRRCLARGITAQPCVSFSGNSSALVPLRRCCRRCY